MNIYIYGQLELDYEFCSTHWVNSYDVLTHHPAITLIPPSIPHHPATNLSTAYHIPNTSQHNHHVKWHGHKVKPQHEQYIHNGSRTHTLSKDQAGPGQPWVNPDPSYK